MVQLSGRKENEMVVFGLGLLLRDLWILLRTWGVQLWFSTPHPLSADRRISGGHQMQAS